MDYHVIASSCHTTKSKGVLIAAERNLNFFVQGTGGCTNGPVIFCKIVLDEIKVALICV